MSHLLDVHHLPNSRIVLQIRNMHLYPQSNNLLDRQAKPQVEDNQGLKISGKQYLTLGSVKVSSAKSTDKPGRSRQSSTLNELCSSKTTPNGARDAASYSILMKPRGYIYNIHESSLSSGKIEKTSEAYFPNTETTNKDQNWA